MNLSDLNEVNELSAELADLREAVSMMPSRNEILKHLEGNPTALRVALYIPSPGGPAGVSAPIPPALYETMLDTQLASLRQMEDELVKKLAGFGVNAERAPAGTVQTFACNDVDMGTSAGTR